MRSIPTREDARRLLDGVVVLDFSRIIAGPFAAEILGDLGATVVKFEEPGGDETRRYTADQGTGSIGPLFVSMNRNKKSLVVDLRADEGRATARELAARADVLIENYRTGVADRLGVGYDALSALNPRLVYCSITGFGTSGPLAGMAANDLIMQAFSGLMSFTGEPDRPPIRVSASISDLAAALFATIGILGALVERTSSGRGQRVETSLFESLLSLIGHHFTEHWLTGYVPRPLGSANRMGMPNQAFATSDGWIVLSAVTDRMWTRSCDALGVPDVATDPRFATLTDRYRNRPALVATISEAVRRLTTADCVARCSAAGVPCAPINSIPQVAEHPQFASVAIDEHVELADGSIVRTIRTPLHFSRSLDPTTYAPPPVLDSARGEMAQGVHAVLGRPSRKTEGVMP